MYPDFPPVPGGGTDPPQVTVYTAPEPPVRFSARLRALFARPLARWILVSGVLVAIAGGAYALHAARHGAPAAPHAPAQASASSPHGATSASGSTPAAGTSGSKGTSKPAAGAPSSGGAASSPTRTSGGSSGSGNTGSTPAPTVTLSASPASVTSGSGSTLTWSSTYATGCAASGAWSGSKSTAGSAGTGALSASSTYTLTCSGSGGSAHASATVTVTASAGLAGPAGYTNDVFDDTFSGQSLNTAHWIEQMADENGIWDDNGNLPSPYSAVGNQGNLNAEYGSPDQVSVDNGLTLNARRDSTFSGYSWKAGYVDTHGKFTFSHGYVQIRAKLPDSTTGGWAGMWFLEGGGEIDLNESGYTACGSGAAVNRCIASNLHTAGNSQSFYDTGVDLSAGYHTYGMEYKPGQSVTIYFDGKQIARYTANVPTGAYTIILTETMAQNASGWHTLVSGTTPSPLSAYQVSEVQVWQ